MRVPKVEWRRVRRRGRRGWRGWWRGGRRGWRGRRRRLELHHKGLFSLVWTGCQREALSKSGSCPLIPIPAVPVRVHHVQGARCAERHRQRHARGVWRATAQRGAVGAAEAPGNFVLIRASRARDHRGDRWRGRRRGRRRWRRRRRGRNSSSRKMAVTREAVVWRVMAGDYSEHRIRTILQVTRKNPAGWIAIRKVVGGPDIVGNHSCWRGQRNGQFRLNNKAKELGVWIPV